MGKSKPEGGRSKSRPSSSSMAASLISSGVSTAGFGGYLGNTRVDSSAIGEEAGSSGYAMDGELAQHLKRLSRKDPTTKVKALTTLSILFKQSPGSELALVVPKWVFEYKKLLYDYSRDVRRMTHEAMTNLAIAVRRGLAPHIKSLMGPWWFSQFDPVPEIAQAARRSLEAAFPSQEKRLDALVHCSSEILIYLEENLRIKPQEMMEKSIPPDELEEMHSHVISSSLLAIATLIDVLIGKKLQTDASDKAKEVQNLKVTQTINSSAERIFSAHKGFLNFFKSKSPRVRLAAYSTLGSYIQQMPQVFNEENVKSLSAAIVSVFSEKDPSCHSSMWDMVLLFSTKFPDQWFQANFQKSFLPRFWNFLQNGCYGSQGVSYPFLILLLDSVPGNAFGGESFLLKFLQNLWAGRNPYSSSSELDIFFKTFSECFLWGLFNASRFSIQGDVSSLQLNLLVRILVGLLWHGYLLPVSKDQEQTFYSKCNSLTLDESQVFQARFSEGRNVNYPFSHSQELAKCIIVIISRIHHLEVGLLQTFCEAFQNDCLYICQQADNGQPCSMHLRRVKDFLLLLNELVIRENEAWPLSHVAGPLFAKLFPLLKTLDSPDAVHALQTIVQIFGPRTIVSHIFTSITHSERESFDECDDTVKNFFLKFFEDDVLPLCLKNYDRSSSSRVELLISFLDGDIFLEQWTLVMAYAEKMQKHPGNERVSVLALLFGKLRENMVDQTPGIKRPILSSLNKCWKHDFLDSVAVSISRQSELLMDMDVSFLCAALGGSSEHDQICFLSEETVLVVFEEISRKLMGFLSTAPFNWEKSPNSLLQASSSWLSACEAGVPLETSVEMVQSVFDIINGCVFCLRRLADENPELIASILAVIRIIEWETTITVGESAIEKSDGFLGHTEVHEFIYNDTSLNHNPTRLSLGKKIKDFHGRIGSQFLRSLSAPCRSKLEDILVLTIKTAISDKDTVAFPSRISFFCKWIMDILEDTCADDLEEQKFLTKLFSGAESWAFWVSPGVTDCGSSTLNFKYTERTQEEIHQMFASFVSKLFLNLGVGRVIGGRPLTPPILSVGDYERKPVNFLCSRPWLAAELLCSWKWHGGGASESLLPLLTDFTQTEISTEENIMYSIVKILIDGAIIQTTSGLPRFLNAWMLSDDEIENISNTYLRALIALLQTLFVKTNTWTKKEAYSIIEYAIGKMGKEVDSQCLRTLPFILNMVIQQLQDGELASDESKMRSYSSQWLEKALSLTSLALGEAEFDDSTNWVQLVISCHPLCIIRENTSIQVKASVELNNSEREALLTLFRMQRAISEDRPSMKTKTMLANLMLVVVGYCYHDFDDDDWDFVFCQLKSLTNLSVLLMEEVAESVDAIASDAGICGRSDTSEKKIEEAVQIIVPLSINITRIALVAFYLICQLEKNGEITDAMRPTWPETWEPIKNNIYDHALRLFFATGVTESIAGSIDTDKSFIIASNRLLYSHFWELVSLCVIDSPFHSRASGLQSMEFWGLSKGPISSLYAVLFSSRPLSSLQFAAFHLLSSEAMSKLSVLKESCLQDATTQGENVIDSSSDESSCLREELSSIIGNSASDILKTDTTSLSRVNIYLSWALLLSYLQSLPSSSSSREKLVLCIQDSVSPIILDLVFQQFPLKVGSVHGARKKDVELPVETKKATEAANCALTSLSLLFSVEKLWPISVETMAAISGSIYAMMIRLLPAYVRNWFTALRDRSLSQSIESFTKAWCSPPLFSEELSQIKGAGLGDDNFSVTVSKSALEIIATYKKEESGMDLVIRLPSCYPLRPVDVDCTRSLGVSEIKQRKWLLSLTAFVCNQNGAIAEAIRIWKSNLEREFEGLEECPICYSIIHTANHSLPRLACKTCKHKFHSACLYKWFATSHKSTCPLCQTPF